MMIVALALFPGLADALTAPTGRFPTCRMRSGPIVAAEQLPAAVRAVIPAGAGLGAGVVVLRQVAVQMRKEREERQERERIERQRARASGLKNAAAVGVLPALAVTATVFLGPAVEQALFKPESTGTPTPMAVRKVPAQQREKPTVVTPPTGASTPGTGAAPVTPPRIEDLKVAPSPSPPATPPLIQDLKVSPSPSPPLPSPPAPVSATALGLELPNTPTAIAAVGLFAVIAAKAASGGAEVDDTSPLTAEPGLTSPEEDAVEEDVVWPTEGQVTSWYDAGVRL
uniref:Uncharacterized protein n=1 Tax=Calcidiscus leptoporus TaxID=127549 RepID=A0A7S0J660_9EUKA|mmetsp:Transcript_40176/g.93759  ORF Transcript_40176/g.93759 Transcript_40176/m.93759 type:complete len:284 (+) Transcript_40176:16-867(+)|eukprot:CAMPEP_0119375114 /NCGR_PEP_ID=MMETSP1334-20130426/33794_1 /TAXON_ID=127549 /ORGANISM="Calcidiscus leptoporus, Strain RCC1130" /LENGTH=283 /DNA_ID=CAMNT_0007393339 /DNA_START=14 /DNA_END=865 /DNA_ORIENTATION=+